MNINLHTWFANRDLDYCPKHFVGTKTKLTEESKLWILENLKGRFYIVSIYEDHFHFVENKYPFFEDSQEALLYELTWS